jgi:hypothetical protein
MSRGATDKHFMARNAAEILVGNIADVPNLRTQRGKTFTFVAAEHCREQQTRLRQREESHPRRDEPEQDVER